MSQRLLHLITLVAGGIWLIPWIFISLFMTVDLMTGREHVHVLLTALQSLAVLSGLLGFVLFFIGLAVFEYVVTGKREGRLIEKYGKKITVSFFVFNAVCVLLFFLNV